MQGRPLRKRWNAPLKRFRRESAATLQLGLPVVVAQLLQLSMQFVDTVMAGQISAADLAALAIASALFHPVYLFMIGILMAITPIVAQLKGERQHQRIGLIVLQGLWLSLMLAIPMIFLLPNFEPLMAWMGYEPRVSEIADGYLEAICWGAPASLVFAVLRHSNEGLGITRPNMYFHLLGLALNILGNYTLMFGHFGFPALGAVGAGWTTSIVWNMMVFGMLVFCLFNPGFGNLRKFTSFRFPSKKPIQEILRVGLPNGFSTATEVGLFAVVALMMGTLGATSMAAHQIAINVAALTFMIPLGLSTAITARVGLAMGRGKIRQARNLGFSGTLLCALIMAGTACMYISVPHWIVGFYTNVPAVAGLAEDLIFMAAVFQLSDGLQVGALGALRGLKDTRVPFLFNLVSYWIFGLPVAFLFGVRWEYGPSGMWVGLIAGLTVAAVLHNSRFHLLTRRLIDRSGTVFPRVRVT